MIPVTRTIYSCRLWGFGDTHNTLILSGSEEQCIEHKLKHNIDGFIAKQQIFISTGLWEEVK